MPNKVEPGMRFRDTYEGTIVTAIDKPSASAFWNCANSRGERIHGSQFNLEAEQHWQPIPEPAPELCAFPGCNNDPDFHQCGKDICYKFSLPGGCRRNNRGCHIFVAPQAQPAAKDIPSPVTSCAPGTSGKSAEAARGGEAAISRSIHLERGPSAVAAAPAIEPWRPTVDDDFWIPNASEGWRR